MGVDGEPDAANVEGAEEIRAWLVLHRGGAPFLSAADGALLADWLEAGVPVPTILRSIEIVAERRRATKSRPALTLRSCKSVVTRLAKGGGAWRVPADLAQRLAPAEPGGDAVAEALAALGALTGDPPARAQAACAVLRRFHERVWGELPPDERRSLLDAAAEELAPLQKTLGEDGFREACEEVARDRVRARYPTLSATRVWEEFGLGLA